MIWPANSWVFWLVVVCGLVAFVRFGLFGARVGRAPRPRLVIVGLMGVAAVAVTAILPSLVFAGLTGAGVSADAVDVVLWCLAAAVGIAALILACWALFADRSRGRKRCPRCWYDMSGTPTLKCSECGTVVAAERKLFKTRRRWSVVGIAALMVVVAGATAIGPKVRDDTWPELIPDVVMIASAPYTVGGPAFKKEVEERVNDGDVAAANQDGWLVRRKLARWAAMRCLREEVDGTIISRGIALAWDPSFNTPEVRALMDGHTRHAGPMPSRAAMQWFAYNAWGEAETSAIIERIFTTNDAAAAKLIGWSFFRGTYEERGKHSVQPQVLALSHRPEPLARVTAARFLAFFRHDGAYYRWRDRVLSDESPEVRQVGLSRLLFELPIDQQVIEATLAALRYSDGKELDGVIMDLCVSECQNERLWRAFPGAFLRLGLSRRTEQRLYYASRGPSPARSEAFLRLAHHPTMRMEIANLIARFDLLTDAQIHEMKALAVQWWMEGDSDAAVAMDAAVRDLSSRAESAQAAEQEE